MRKLIILVTTLILFLTIWSFAANYLPNASDYFKNLTNKNKLELEEKVKVVTEESVTIDVVKRVKASVVTVVLEKEESIGGEEPMQIGPFRIFGFQEEGNTEPQNIGSGFVVSKDGLVVTNKHVVSSAGNYSVITGSEKKYKVEKIYRDPLNDIAILKIDPSQNKTEALIPVEFGDSSKLEVGQFVVAMGTALGEFRNTVTTGVISGLGRGITAGNEFQGFVERLDNVIQTDAAINYGNSGGPLLNSSGQVIGINTAIASGGQNIGFALPINILKESIKAFNESGQFERAYLGVSYKMITREQALLNDVVQGAYVQLVVNNSPAEKAGIKQGDIIVKVDNKKIDGEKDELATIIASKKTGQVVIITVWRQGKTTDLKTVLTSAGEE